MARLDLKLGPISLHITAWTGSVIYPVHSAGNVYKAAELLQTVPKH